VRNSFSFFESDEYSNPEHEMPDFPFESAFDVVQARLDEFVSAVVSSLQSEFLILPKGEGFVEYSEFETGYEALKRATSGFSNLTSEIVLTVVRETPIAFIVLRTMLGFTPPEWAHMATLRTGVDVPQGAVRSIDRKIRMAPLNPLSKGEITQQRVVALVEVACALLAEGAPEIPPEKNPSPQQGRQQGRA
jgi:hypothetical protein